MKRNSIYLSVMLFMFSACNQKNKQAENTANADTVQNIYGVEFPYEFKYEGNPISRMHGAADPDVNIWDGVLWMYCSHDRNKDTTIHIKGYDSMDGYHVFSTTDMINWTDHGVIFHSDDVDWGWEKGGFMWAPCAARKDGKYYLYFPHKDKEGDWKVGVAIGDSPTGPFKDTGKPIEGLNGIDPKVFIDDDGEAYLYNNPGIVAKLKPNMIELAEEPKKIIYASEEIMKNDTLKYKEGPYMHKRNNTYYFSYSNWKNDYYQGYYAMADNPYGPFEWKGAMAPKPSRSQDHHSIVEFNGQWYYFYHIAIKEYPTFREGQGRIACFDSLHYNEDGTIKMVEHTLNVSE